MRLGENQSALLKCLHLEALCVRVLLRDSLVTLGGYHHLDGLEQWGSLSAGWWLSVAPIIVIMKGSWPFPSGEPKGTLVDYSWLVWSSSCVGYVAPYWGFGVWSQLAHEPPSEWIATTRTSLPASKWTSIKNHCVIFWFWGDWSSLLFIIVIDWFLYLHGGITFLSLSLHYRKLVVKLFSVASCESLLVWLVDSSVSFWEHTNLV